MRNFDDSFFVDNKIYTRFYGFKVFSNFLIDLFIWIFPKSTLRGIRFSKKFSKEKDRSEYRTVLSVNAACSASYQTQRQHYKHCEYNYVQKFSVFFHFQVFFIQIDLKVFFYAVRPYIREH